MNGELEMKSIALAAAAAAALLACPAVAQDAPQWSLAIHGGAGVIERAQLSPERDAAYRAGLQAALDAGSAVLARGGSSLDAVQAAIEVMEENPLFNAGRGAVFTSAGKNELDAAVMDGTDLNAGAVAGLTRTRHPIAAARAVMEKSPHVMLIGEGAETFARLAGLEEVAPSFFFTESRWQALLKALRDRGEPLPPRPEGAPPEPARLGPAAPLAFNLHEAPLDERKFGTVGAVAVDSQGRLAAGTSTGGTTAKRWAGSATCRSSAPAPTPPTPTAAPSRPPARASISSAPPSRATSAVAPPRAPACSRPPTPKSPRSEASAATAASSSWARTASTPSR